MLLEFSEPSGQGAHPVVGGLSNEIETIARQDAGCERLMSVPGIGPIVSSAMVAAIGAGDVFTKGRDFAAWLGLVPKQISTGDRTILGKISRRSMIKLKIWERLRRHHVVGEAFNLHLRARKRRPFPRNEETDSVWQ